MEAGNFDGVGAHRRRVVEGKSGAARAEPSIRRHGAVRDGETEQVWDPGGRCCGGAAEPRRHRGPLEAELGGGGAARVRGGALVEDEAQGGRGVSLKGCRDLGMRAGERDPR